MDLTRWLSRLICCLRRLQVEEVENIPSRGPALIATTHSSPLDLFYCLTLMRRVGRSDYRFVVAAEMLNREHFRRYTQASLERALPAARLYGPWVAGIGSLLVPLLFQGLKPIPIYRSGDDSETRREALSSLLKSQLVGIAPEWGNDSHRGANGLRPLTHGVASIARQYFDAAREPLAVIPMAICAPRSPWLSQVRLRVGKPFRGMSAKHYPELFSNRGTGDDTIKHQAYRHFTQGLADRLADLS
jgi:1-acyl-sn-glycerol-3-phosphate acyltransferase